MITFGSILMIIKFESDSLPKIEVPFLERT